MALQGLQDDLTGDNWVLRCGRLSFDDVKGNNVLIRAYLSNLSRKAGVLQALDHLRYLKKRLENRRKNREFNKNHPDFRTPPPFLAYDAFSSVDWPYYYKTGMQSARRIADISRRHLSSPPRKYLEWGCGPAQVIRHMPALLKDCEVFGSDYNPKTIAWCEKTIPGVEFSVNQLGPPLRFVNEDFDCVVSLSVLTHLSAEMCRAWLEELARVTRSGGIIVMTIKGDSHEARLLPKEKERLREGLPVIRKKIREGKRMYDTILPKKFFEAILPPSLEVIEQIPDGMPEYQQDLWILRKKSSKPEKAETALVNDQ